MGETQNRCVGLTSMPVALWLAASSSSSRLTGGWLGLGVRRLLVRLIDQLPDAVSAPMKLLVAGGDHCRHRIGLLLTVAQKLAKSVGLDTDGGADPALDLGLLAGA